MTTSPEAATATGKAAPMPTHQSDPVRPPAANTEPGIDTPGRDADASCRLDRDNPIARCDLCDAADGYRGTTPCDHIDHYADTTQGRAAVADELQKIRNRRRGATP